MIDPEKMDLESQDCWTYAQRLSGHPNSTLLVSVNPSKVALDAVYPTQGKEWYEIRYHSLLTEFRKFFDPKLILSSTVIVRMVLSMKLDTRTFLSKKVMRIESKRIQAFERPIHLVGLRMFFPPYKKAGSKKKSDTVPWGVNIRIESLMDDPTKVFLEAEADWPIAKEWTEEVEKDEVDRLETVYGFLEANIVNFLFGTSDGDGAGPTEPTGDQPADGGQ